jgi:hypothetical protein
VPKEISMHPVLHVSLLKKKMGEGVLISSELSVMGEFGRVKVYPFAILDRKLMKKENRAVVVRLRLRQVVKTRRTIQSFSLSYSLLPL